MAQTLKVKCKGCQKQCPTKPVPIEFALALPEESFDKVLEMKAVLVYCEKRKHNVYLYI